MNLVLTLCMLIEPESSFNHKLVTLDRAFAKRSLEIGYVAAFGEFVFPNGILFEPQPVHLDVWTERRKDAKGTLDWGPTLVGSSLAKDMGYTSGPWTMTGPDGQKAFGHYVSIWKMESTGEPKVIADIGIQHKPLDSDSKLEQAAKSCSVEGVPDLEIGYDQEKTKLVKADGAFMEAQKLDPIHAYELHTDYQLHWYRNGRQPIHGQLDVLDVLKPELDRDSKFESFEILGFDLAESKEFGYTLGKMTVLESGSQKEHHYLRVWKKSYDGAWLVALEVLL